MTTQRANADDHYLPRHKQTELKTTLATIGDWLADDLDLVIARQTRYGAAAEKISQGKNHETPLPFHDSASDAALDLTGTLQAWIDQVCVQRKVAWPGRLRAKQAAKWLIKHTVHLSLCTDAYEAFDEINDAASRAARICDRPNFRRYQGSCEICQADLWSSKTANKIVCGTCRHVVDKERNDQRIDAALEARAYTANELVEIVHDRMGLKIKPKTIHDMAYRKTDPIDVRGHTYDRQKLYNAGDVFRCLRSRKATTA